MPFIKRFKKELLKIKPSELEKLALEAFYFQAENNPVYKKYISLLSINPKSVKQLKKIPFLPIEFFKNHPIVSTKETPQVIFESSGTTSEIKSKHYVSDPCFYDKNAEFIFSLSYGDLKKYSFLALLPSYLERNGSSLVAMVNNFVQKSQSSNSGFYLYNYDELIRNLQYLQRKREKIFLIGVSFALLDLAEKISLDLKGAIVMETGGMKGRRKEITREELHLILKKRFNVDKIHSEYGMTELLSQAYSKGDGIFNSPPQMKVMIRDPYDPFDLNPKKGAGGLNVIDLANIDSCCFIETKDLGRVNEDGSFEIIGRFDASDVRGCNMLL